MKIKVEENIPERVAGYLAALGHEERYRQRLVHHLAKRAEALGMTLVKAQQPA